MDKQGPDATNLYDLTPAEFERLVVDVFSQAGYSSVRLVGGPVDQGVDILATKDNQPVAIQVKHKTRITLDELQRFTDFYFRHPKNPSHLIFVTSAELDSSAVSRIERIPEGARFDIVGRHDFQLMVAAHSALAGEMMKAAAQRLRFQKLKLSLSSLGVVMSIIFAFLSALYPFVSQQKPALDRRIETVEKALASMRDLETYLADIKRDMEDTQKATASIKKQYAEARELEKLTAVQLAGLQATLQVTNWKMTILNYVLGFVLGVAASLVASVIYTRWTQKKALE